MGYKLAGCEVLGCCEIDPKMNEVYVKNHHPKYNFLMDIRDFNKIPDEELPEELFNLDILDGSPPCTTFSMAGVREEGWGKKKKFREGQKEQTLDDLSFIFIETVKKLKPKVVVMENVEGLILGEAFAYVQKIYNLFEAAGYRVNHWLMKGEIMGIPQRRHRVIFVCIRKDLGIDPTRLGMEFNFLPVKYAEAKEGDGKDISHTTSYPLLCKALPTDRNISSVLEREGKKASLFSHMIVKDEDVCPTITAGGGMYLRFEEKKGFSKEDYRNVQTFPQDYDFLSDKESAWQYICGMSVPPVMMKRIVQRLIENGVFKYKEALKE